MKYILITGSSQGIGKGIALHFGGLGYHVFVTYHAHHDLGLQTIGEIEKTGGTATLIQVNVADENSVKAMYTEIAKVTDTIDVLVNNAGAETGGNLEEVSLADWQKTLYVRLDGDFLCTKYGIPFLKKSENPNILCIMSSLFENIDPNDPAACVADGGTVSFIKALAVYLAQYKIRTNGIGPSETNTNLPYWQKYGTPELFAEVAKDNPLGRLCTPKDVAQAVQLFVDDPSKFLNGNILYVNGGSHLK
jgi:NAD(P)-dependent dehydrogenase (short-subunit alcohol dehydrogenase family)